MGIGNTVGLIKALAPKPDAETITAAVDAWLEDNPEATTTVEDGAISYTKLNSSLQGTVDDVSDLKNAIASMNTATESDEGKALKAKIVSGGKVTEWEFDEASIELDDTLSVAGKAADAKAAGDAINDLAEITTESLTETRKIDVTTEYTIGFMGTNGTVYTGGTYDGFRYTNKIPVKAGDDFYVIGSSGWAPISPRVLTAFNGTDVVGSASKNSPSMPYTVPSGVDGIVITVSATDESTATYYISRIVTEDVVALKPDVTYLMNHTEPKGSNGLVLSFDLDAEGTYTDPDETSFEDMRGYSVSFFAHITSLTGILRINKGSTENGRTVEINSTSIKYCYANNYGQILTTNHGLTIKDYIALTINVGYTEQSIRLCTNGGDYLWSLSAFDANKGALSVYTSLDNLSECVLSYNCFALKADNWLYGDSYFTGWAKKLYTYGFTNNLLNAYPGRNSYTALQSFKADLSFRMIPKRVIWCMGMNDKDGTTEPSAGWTYPLSEVMRICNEKGIELILATIPNVPSSNTKNSIKNTVVRESGYRYIDFAKAVSANDDSTWYDGMLNVDNVHPTSDGALCIYSAAVATVPELLDE